MKKTHAGSAPGGRDERPRAMNDEHPTTLRERLESFSIVSGGLWSRALVACRLGGLRRVDVARRVLVLALLGWVPLLVVTLAEGTLAGGAGSFAWDVGAHVRGLLALPLLIVAERAIDLRFRDEGLAHLEATAILREEEHAARVESALALATRARDSGLASVGLVGVVVALSVHDAVHAPATSSWMYARDASGAAAPTAAGWVDLLACAPLYRLLVVTWVWRWVVWILLLVALARTGLRVSALHADEMGGLRVLSDAHTSFGWVIGALGTTLAGNFTAQRLLLHGSVADYTHAIVVFCFTAPALCLAPMLALAWPVIVEKRRAHRDYAAAAADFARRYRRMHVEPESAKPLGVGSADPSSAEDLGGSFERMLATRWLLVERKQYLFLFGCAFLPMIPFYLQELPMTEIVKGLRDALG